VVNISDTGLFYRGDFFVFLELYFNTLSYAVSDVIVSEDAGIELRTVVALHWEAGALLGYRSHPN
jgi:hypothetical protein